MYTKMLHWSLIEQIKYIRGFADGEGTPIMNMGYKKKNGKLYHQWDRRIKLSNTDKTLLITIKKMMDTVGIKSKIYLDHAAGTGRATKDCWALLVLGRDNIALF